MNLYAKIFIGFWLSMIAIIGSWMIAAHYFTPFADAPEERDFGIEPGADQRFMDSLSKQRRPPGDHRHESKDRAAPSGPPGASPMHPPRAMFRILYALQNLPEKKLSAWIQQQEQKHRLRIFLVNAEGRDIFGRELAPVTNQVLEKLAGVRRRTAYQQGKTTLFGQEIYRHDHGQLTAVVASMAPASPIIKALTEHLWLRLLLAVLISGLISYAVSRYLTRPLKQLQRQIQSQKRLLRDVSHELRSPLARLRVALALAEKDPQRQREQFERIERETERLDELIGQLLAVPEGQLTLEDSLDLVGLLKELSDDANFEAQQSNKSVVYRTTLAEAVVKTSGDLLKKALEKVIRNALTHTASGTSVLIEVEKNTKIVTIAVTDRGPGVPEDTLERIFEPFYRVDDARQRETGGYGLGLSIASRSIRQHGGSIAAENTGDGLRLVINLPI